MVQLLSKASKVRHLLPSPHHTHQVMAHRVHGSSIPTLYQASGKIGRNKNDFHSLKPSLKMMQYAKSSCQQSFLRCGKNSKVAEYLVLCQVFGKDWVIQFTLWGMYVCRHKCSLSPSHFGILPETSHFHTPKSWSWPCH